MHILIVDDTFETTDLFRLCFGLDGHTTETAHDGVQALQIIEECTRNLDVIIMDYHMPHMTGLEVVQQLRQKTDWKPVPIILFTGDAKGSIERQAQDLGVSRVVYKPILPSELIAVAKQLAGQA